MRRNTIAKRQTTAVRAPKGLHGLMPGLRKCLDQRYRSDRAADHAEHRGPPDLVPGRQLRELHLDEVKIVLESSEIVAGLIDLAQRKGIG